MSNYVHEKLKVLLMRYMLGSIVFLALFITMFINVFLLPAIVFFVMFGLWIRYGRNYKDTAVTVHHLEPPHSVSPLEAAYILRGKITQQDITAQILYLASQGYFDLSREKYGNRYDYIFRKDPNMPPPVNVYDAVIMRTLFGLRLHYHATKKDEQGREKQVIQVTEGALVGAMEYLRDDFARNFTDIQEGVVSVLMAKKCFYIRPTEIRYIVSFFIGLTVLTMFALVSSDVHVLTDVLISLFFVFGILVFSRNLFHGLTKEGMRIKRELEGYKHYLEVSEKERIKFFHEPRKNRRKIEAILAYAIVFDLENAWEKELRDLYPDLFVSQMPKVL